MPVIAEYLWVSEDNHGAVRVEVGGRDYLVVEDEWIRVAGDPETTDTGIGPATFTTSVFPGQWSTIFDAAGRHEAYVCNIHSDPGAVVLVEGGPYGPKPIWPDGPAFVAVDWKGPIRIMCPTHANVRCCGSEV